MTYGDVATNLILRFRQLCQEQYPDDIDPVSRDAREQRFETALLDHYMHLSGWGPDSITVPRALAGIARTPRILKAIFRQVWETWEVLHGELDLDDLLVATTLRLGAPEAFEFLQNQMDNIRARKYIDSTRRGSDSKDALKDYLEQEWQRAVKDVAFNRIAARKLMDFLVPLLDDQDADSSPQGVQVRHPTDYWRRMFRGKLEPAEIRDQHVLRMIDAWLRREGDDDQTSPELIQALYDDQRFTDIFEHFSASLLDGYDVRNLASLLFQAMLAGHGVKANNESSPGFLALWRLSLRKPVSESAHRKWVLGELEKASGVSLRFANDVYYFWRHTHFNSKDEAIAQLDPTLRREYIRLVRSDVEHRPKRFIRLLDPLYIFSVYQFSVLFSLLDEGGPGFNGEEWRWMGVLLLEAAELEPQVVVPQIAPLIVTSDRDSVSYVYSVNREVATTMFGPELSRLVRVLQVHLDLDGFSEEVRRLVRYAQRLSLEDLKRD